MMINCALRFSISGLCCFVCPGITPSNHHSSGVHGGDSTLNYYQMWVAGGESLALLADSHSLEALGVWVGTFVCVVVPLPTG
jgi:hypothetical protein